MKTRIGTPTSPVDADAKGIGSPVSVSISVSASVESVTGGTTIECRNGGRTGGGGGGGGNSGSGERAPDAVEVESEVESIAGATLRLNPTMTPITKGPEPEPSHIGSANSTSSITNDDAKINVGPPKLALALGAPESPASCFLPFSAATSGRIA